MYYIVTLSLYRAISIQHMRAYERTAIWRAYIVNAVSCTGVLAKILHVTGYTVVGSNNARRKACQSNVLSIVRTYCLLAGD